MTVAYTHTDPLLAAGVANAIAQRYVESTFKKKIEQFTSASEWLDRSTRELKAKVERAEQSLADYTKTKNIYGMEGKSSLITEKLAKLHDQATRAETERILKESLHKQVLQGRINQIPEAFADTQTAELQRKLDDLSIKAAELSVTYGPKYQQMVEINQQIATIRDQIAASRTLLEQKLRADYERAVQDESALKIALASAKDEAATENQSAIQYSILKQDVDTTKALYIDFLQKTSQAYLEVAQQQSNVRVIAPARVPKNPVDQHRQRTILFAMVLSLVGGVGLAWLLDRLDDSIRNIDDVTQFTQLPALAVIPVIGATGRRKRLAASTQGSDSKAPGEIPRARLMEFDGRSSAAESYRALRTGLLLSGTGNPPRTILLTSVRSNEGKTTTASNIAISLAQLGSSVLLIDCDLRKPSVHTAFGIAPAPGLSTYLAQNGKIDDIIHQASENLCVIPAGPTPPNPAELLSSGKMKRLVEFLAERYDHVVIDTPPLGSVTDPVILSTMVDGVVLVVHAGRNKRNAVQRACRELSAVGARIFGIVLNSVNMKREGYADYQYYYYGYSSEEEEVTKH
jgi:capsular exopolysaccharide synthesis family protein